MLSSPRVLLAAVVVALLASLWSVDAAPRQLDPPQSHSGVWTASFAVANGYDGRVIGAKEYADYVKSGSCMPRSHATVWPNRDRHGGEIQLVCEL